MYVVTWKMDCQLSRLTDLLNFTVILVFKLPSNNSTVEYILSGLGVVMLITEMKITTPIN